MKKIAVKYQIDGFGEFVNGVVFVEATKFKKTGEVTRWAVRRHNTCMNRQGEFGYEPMPSERDDQFLKDYRFTSLQKAVEIYNKTKKKREDLERSHRGS